MKKNQLLDLLRQTLRRNRNDILPMIIALGVICVLGVSVAVAAISIGPDAIQDAAMRPLSTAPGLIVAPAFGADDEDCITATSRQVLPNGSVRVNHELICDQ